MLKWVLADFNKDSAIKENDFLAGFWRAERSSAQGVKPFPTASRFFRVRFKNSKAQDFWREDFFGEKVVHKRITLDPPIRSRVKNFAYGKLPYFISILIFKVSAIQLTKVFKLVNSF